MQVHLIGDRRNEEKCPDRRRAIRRGLLTDKGRNGDDGRSPVEGERSGAVASLKGSDAQGLRIHGERG